MSKGLSILLISIPGLMFCVIPVRGMEFSFSWQLASLWLAGLAFCTLLSGWWLRLFFLVALARTATLPPVMEAYTELLMLAIFLAAIDGFRLIDSDLVMDAMCVAAIGLLAWTLAQNAGLVRAYFGSQSIGPFNPDLGGVFLALCLPACLRSRRWPLAPFIMGGICLSRTTTGFLAAVSALIVWSMLHFTPRDEWKFALPLLSGLVVMFCWFWVMDPVQNTIHCPRWEAWRQAINSMGAGIWGRGLGSWKDIFPLIASGNPALGEIANAGGPPVLEKTFLQAHNEYIQVLFELGIQGLAVIVLFLAAVAGHIWRGNVSDLTAAGMAALAIGCFGVFVMHEAPPALLGCAWLGIYQKELKR